MAEKFIVPKSVAVAARLKDDKSAFLAGGTEINRLDSCVRAGSLISIGRLGLDTINEAEIDGKPYVRIGATATFQECVENEKVPAWFRQACLFMSSRTKRNMATVGGNVAIARDDSYLIPSLVAGVSFVEFFNGRILKVEKYVKDHFRYTNRLIVAIYVDPAARVEAKRYSNTAAGHAYVTVAVSEKAVAAQIKGAGLIETNAITKSADRSEKACLRWIKNLKNPKVRNDMYGSSAYKRYLTGVTVAMLSEKVREASK